MTAIREALIAAGLPVVRPIPSETWECLRPRPNYIPAANRKLSTEDARAVRECLALGVPKADLAAEFGVDVRCIYRIAEGVTYREERVA